MFKHLFILLFITFVLYLTFKDSFSHNTISPPIVDMSNTTLIYEGKI